ncbi:MAG: redoxin domain-containing protein [Myxococcota bacterium]|nr:redoxin domain-containing protein [Myxococcota bacterium]
MRAGLILLTACTPELVTPGLTPEADLADSECDWLSPDNDWSMGEPPCLEAEGFESGQIVPDIRLMDQNGDEVSLWQFYGDLIFLDFSAEWCAPCAVLAEGADELLGEVAEAGVSMVTVIYNGSGSPALDQQALLDWAAKSGNVAPVLSDDGTWTDQVIPLGGSYPALLLIDRDMRVIYDDIQPPKDHAVLHAIEENL